MAAPGECCYNTLFCCSAIHGSVSTVWTLYFSSLSVVSRAFSALCMYSKFGHHPRLIGYRYVCAKFRFFHGLHCWASPWRKRAYSIDHSLSHSASLFDASGKEVLTLRNYLLCETIKRVFVDVKCRWCEMSSLFTTAVETNYTRSKNSYYAS